MNFIIDLLILADWKSDSYDLILVTIDKLTKMIHYELIKVMINTPGLAKVIIIVIICYHKVVQSIVTDCSLLFISKFWFLLYNFLRIKRKLSTAFHS